MARRCPTGRRADGGFTLLELLVVLFIVGLIAAVAAPAVTSGITRAREAALKENLAVMRRAIDDYYTDTGTYPSDLPTLVEERYLRHLPDHPMDREMDWRTVSGAGGGVEDVRSALDGPALDGSNYGDW